MSDSLTVEQLYVLKRQIDDLKAINTYIKANRDGKLPKKNRPTTTPTTHLFTFRANQSASTKKRGRGPSSASNPKRNLVRIVSEDRDSSEEDDKDEDDGDDNQEEEEASSDGEEHDEEQDIVLPSGSGSDGSDFKLDKQRQKELFNEILPQRTLPARKRTVKSFRELLTTDEEEEEEDDDNDDEDQGFEEEEEHNSDSDGGQSDPDDNDNNGIEASLDEEDADAAATLLTTVNVATTTIAGGGGEGGGGGDNQVEPAVDGV